MNAKILCAALVLVVSTPLLFGTFMAPTGAQAKPAPPWDWKWEPYGPRPDAIIYKIILAYESRLLAFEADEIDWVGIMPEHVDRIKKNRPDAFLLETMGRVVDALQFNIRPKKEPSGADNYPMNVLEFRKALAHMIDRDYAAFEAYKGYAVPAFTPMPGLYGDWISPKARTYEYNMDKARKLLDDASFRVGSDGWRIDPRTNSTLRELEVLVLPEATSPQRFMVAKHLVFQAEKLGIRIRIRTVDAPTLDRLVTEAHEHDMYYWGWSLGMYPTHLYYFFRSEEEKPGGWNECGVRNAELDDYLMKFYFAPNVEEAKANCHKALELVQEIVPWVPTTVPIAITAFNGKLRGMVLQKAPGVDTPLGRSWLDELNVHISPLPFGYTYRSVIGVQLGTLNPMTYLWSAEADIIDDIYEVNTIGNPEDQYERLPRLAEKIEVSAFEDKPGTRNTKITISLTKGLIWQDGEPLTSKDYNFTIWYPGKEWKTRRFYSEFEKKTYKTETPNPQTIIVYLEGTSFLYQVAAEGYRPLPEHIYSKLKDPKKDDPGKLPHPKVSGLTMLVGQGPYILKEYVPGTHALNSWNPDYYMTHPESKNYKRTVTRKILVANGLDFSKKTVPTSIFSDDQFVAEIEIKDMKTNATVANASVSVAFYKEEGLVKTVNATHVRDGTYKVLMSDLQAGSYQALFSAESRLKVGAISRLESFDFTVDPIWKKPAYQIATMLAIAVVIGLFVFYRRQAGKREVK